MLAEKVYPIGTVVTLKKRTERYMITGALQLMKDGDLLDYISVRYPLGLVDKVNELLFNHDDIDEVLFMGYWDEDETEYRNVVRELEEKLKEAAVLMKEKKDDIPEKTELE